MSTCPARLTREVELLVEAPAACPPTPPAAAAFRLTDEVELLVEARELAPGDKEKGIPLYEAILHAHRGRRPLTSAGVQQQASCRPVAG